MPLSWNEIKSKALGFSKTWADAASEDSQAKPFWIDIFGQACWWWSRKKHQAPNGRLYKYHLRDKIKIMAGAAVGQV